MHTREGSGLLPLKLDPQQVENVAAGKDIVEMMGDFKTKFRPSRTHQCRWAANDNVGTEFAESPNVAPRRSTVSNVTHQGNGQALYRTAMLPNRQHIKETLGRMIMRAIARVQDATP